MNNKQLEYEYGITADRNGICDVCHFEAKVATYDLGYVNRGLIKKQVSSFNFDFVREVCPECMLEIARYLKSKFKTGE